MTQNQIELVRTSWSKVATLDPEVVGELFYDRLFTIAMIQSIRQMERTAA